jgi:DNA-binding Lrp family transcriptional regulator
VTGPPRVDETDRLILQWLQDAFPVVRHPWREGAGAAAVGEEEFLARTQRLSREGVIRSLHAFIDHRFIRGRASTLVAMKVPENAFSRIVPVINAYPSISHNYRRDHGYNLWFTITTTNEGDLEHTLAAIRDETGIPASNLLDLRTERVFKINVRFDFGRDGRNRDSPVTPDPAPRPVLEALDHALLNRAQEGIPLVPDPFQEMGEALGIDPDTVLERLRALVSAGIIRKIGISVNQRAVGILANALVAWKVPAEGTGDAGRALASLPEVTHCYQRRTVPGRWEYTLYTVLHGKDEGSVRARVERHAEAIGTCDYLILFSREQFKRTSIMYHFPAEITT